MLIELDFESDEPIYLQLKMRIIEGIATGKLKPGQSLPSVRQLASDIGINLHTVNKTYTHLKQDGFIIVHRQKGVIVNSDGGPSVTTEYLGSLKSILKPVIAEAYCRKMSMEEFIELCSNIFNDLKVQGGEL